METLNSAVNDNAATFDQALAAFLVASQERLDASYSAEFPANCKEFYFTQPGKRFIRIVRGTDNRGSCHCFVEIATGDIYKSASWKAPAKGIRGNIFRGIAGTGIHGAVYNYR